MGEVWLVFLLGTAFLEYFEYRKSDDASLILACPIVLLNIPSFLIMCFALIAYCIYKSVKIIREHEILKARFIMGYAFAAMAILWQLNDISVWLSRIN